MNLTSFNDSNAVIGARIRRCRLNWQLTQDDLATAIDVSPNYIGEIERGRRSLTLPVAEQLCLVFGVTYDYLYLGMERSPDQLLRENAPGGRKKKKSSKELLLSFIASSKEEDCRDYLALLSEIKKLLDRKKDQ